MNFTIIPTWVLTEVSPISYKLMTLLLFLFHKTEYHHPCSCYKEYS